MMSLGNKIHRLPFYITAILFFFITVSGCGEEKNKSEGAVFEVLPSTPIVILGDVEIGDKKVQGPWFSFRVKMANTTDEDITIIALSITIFAQSENGQQVKTEVAFSPSDFNFEITTGTGDSAKTFECKFHSFGTWAKGQASTSLSLDNGNTDCAGRIPIFYIGNGEKGRNGNNFRYRVEVKPQGWFGDYYVPKDRFNTDFVFYTQ